MESANNHHHHHQLQDQVVGSFSSSSSATPSCYGVCTTTHAWSTTIPTSFLNTNNGFTSYTSEPILNRPQETIILSSQYDSNMAGPNLAFQNRADTRNNYNTNHQPVQGLHFPRIIKEEFSDHYHRKYTGLLNDDTNNEQRSSLQPSDFGTKLLLKSLSPENLMNHMNINNQIFRTMNVSSLDQMRSNLDMNLEAQDLLTPSSFSGNFGMCSHDHRVGILRDGFSDYAHMHQIPFYSSNNKLSAPISNGAVEAKRSSSKIEPKPTHQNATKKSRVEAGASFPPFKVRKEKLGDRIAALQQLVAPFGKQPQLCPEYRNEDSKVSRFIKIPIRVTDTASVLMESIGYIKFLQDQVETLSVPYMNASQKKSCRRIKAGSADHQNANDEDSKRDLRSRGLCLVPLSCLSYIADGGATTLWRPPHFGGSA